MSGEKCRYVSIEQQELRRLREQDSRLRSLQRDLPERLNAIREEGRRELQQRLEPLVQRTQQQELEAKKLKSNLATLELETHRRMQQQRKDLQTAIRNSETKQQEALASEVKRLENAMQEGFSQQRSLLLEITAEQRQEYLSLNQQIEQKFDRLIAEERQAREQLQQYLEQERQDKAKLAQDLLDDVEVIWRQIDRDYQHQRFAPDKLDDLYREITFAQINIQQGIPEAAIATTQRTYLALADLRLDIERQEQEWQIYYNAAMDDLKCLIIEVQANRECQLEIGKGDESEKFVLEVDYWTNGSLNQYEQQLQQIETHLREGALSLSTEQLKQVAQQIQDLQPRLGEIVEQARVEILSSQLRAEIADKVATVLGEMGYRLVDPETNAIYEGDDQRQAYVLKLQDVNGGEVVTVISPEKEFGKNQVSINSFGKILQDEKAQKQNAEAIFQTLELNGIENGPLRCNDNPRQEYRNMDEVKQRQVTNSVQEVTASESA